MALKGTAFKSGSGGFTLVELAIVMTIIGLLIGGVLKGQELVTNARVNATAAQLKAYEAASISFMDTYGALPGDLLRAPTILPGCTLGCTAGAQDGFIGAPARAIYDFRNEVSGMLWWTAGNTLVANVQNRSGHETWLFFQHLFQANLITGITDKGLIEPTRPAWGVTHPTTKIGGGFVARSNRTGELPPGSTTSNLTGGPMGSVMLLFVDTLRNLQVDTSQPTMTSTMAWMIDRKMDDGFAGKGSIQGIGPNCYEAGTDTSYDLSRTLPKQCALAISLIK